MVIFIREEYYSDEEFSWRENWAHSKLILKLYSLSLAAGASQTDKQPSKQPAKSVQPQASQPRGYVRIHDA